MLKSSDVGGDTVFVNQYFDFRPGGDLEDIGSKHVFAGGMRVVSLVDRYDPSSDGTVPPENPGVPYYFHGDHLGSTNLITGEDGSVYEHLEYFPDGELWFEQKPQTVLVNGYRSSGKFLDVETGFYDFGQRFYDPKTGIWLSVDPLFTESPGEAVGRPLVMSLYSYANHSPMRFIDPDGRDGCDSVLGCLETVGYGIGYVGYSVVPGADALHEAMFGYSWFDRQKETPPEPMPVTERGLSLLRAGGEIVLTVATMGASGSTAGLTNGAKLGSTGAKAGANAAGKAEAAAQKAASLSDDVGKSLLFGEKEYIVADPVKAAKVRAGLEKFYEKITGKAFNPSYRAMPNNGFLNTVNGEISISDELVTKYPHLLEGTILEELQHFHQIVSKGLYGQVISQQERQKIEDEVIRRLLRSGLEIFRGF